MRILGELFGRGKREDSPAENKTDVARRIWETIGMMVGNGKPTTFSVVEKIGPRQLPPDLKTWDYLGSIPNSFDVSITSGIGRVIVLTSGTRYKKLSIRGPNDVVPVFEEGTIAKDREVSFASEPQKDPLDFADKFARFVSHQREHTQGN